jgi:hypothetical protein
VKAWKEWFRGPFYEDAKRHSIDPAFVETAWQDRCDSFAAANRAWMIAAIAWLLITIALVAAAFLFRDDWLFYGSGAALLFLLGMPIFEFASEWLESILQCPSCGERAMEWKLFGTPDPSTLESCGSCGCQLHPNSDT